MTANYFGTYAVQFYVYSYTSDIDLGYSIGVRLAISLKSGVKFSSGVGGYMKKIALFSDIHGNYQVLSSILDDIKKDNFFEVICLGDVVGIGPESSECLDLIMNTNVTMLLGNHELYQIKGTDIDDLKTSFIEHEKWVFSTLEERHLDYLNKCMLSKDLLLNGKLFTFSHFFFDEKKEYPFYSFSVLDNENINSFLRTVTSDYMFCGHHHQAFQYCYKNSLFTCVGSSGCTLENTCFYTIVEIDYDYVKIYRKEIEYDRKAFEKKIKNSNYPDRDIIANSFFGINIK